MFLRVAEFHRIFNQHISDIPELPSQFIRNLRIRLLAEEMNEFCTAHDHNDMVEMADGLADICYIIAGTCVSYGIAPKEEFKSPYDGVLKQMDVFIHSRLPTLVREDFTKYVKAEEANDLERIKDVLMGMIITIFGIALHLGIPLNAVFDEVHRTNLAKVSEDGKPRYREDGKLLKPEGWTPPTLRIKAILDALNTGS